MRFFNGAVNRGGGGEGDTRVLLFLNELSWIVFGNPKIINSVIGVENVDFLPKLLLLLVSNAHSL